MVYWGYQDNFKSVYLFIYFLGKRFRAHKNTSQAKISEQYKSKLTPNKRDNNFSYGHKLLGVTCFCAREISSSKKNKQSWNCLDNLNIHATALVHLNHYKKFFTFFSVRNENAVLQLATFSNCKLVKYVHLLPFCHFK